MPWKAYNRVLASHPYLTRSCVAAGMMSSGDVIAQRVFERNERHDITRSARFAAYGFFFHAPVLAQWFKVVDRLQLRGAATKSLVAKVALDQTLWGPFSVGMFYSVMSLMEGHSLHEAREKVEVGFWPTYFRGAAVFIPTSALVYSIVPLPHRGLFLQAVGLGWNTYLSAANHFANDTVSEMEEQHAHQAHESTAASPPPRLLPSRTTASLAISSPREGM